MNIRQKNSLQNLVHMQFPLLLLLTASYDTWLSREKISTIARSRLGISSQVYWLNTSYQHVAKQWRPCGAASGEEINWNGCNFPKDENTVLLVLPDRRTGMDPETRTQDVLRKDSRCRQQYWTADPRSHSPSNQGNCLCWENNETRMFLLHYVMPWSLAGGVQNLSIL